MITETSSSLVLMGALAVGMTAVSTMIPIEQPAHVHLFDYKAAYTVANQNVASSSEPFIYKVFTSAHSEKEAVIQELNRYFDLQDDWDGDGAVAISEPVKEDAIKFVKQFPFYLSTPSPMITESGVLSFFWDSSAAYVEMKLLGSGIVSFYIYERLSKKNKFFYDINLSDLDAKNFSDRLSVLSESKYILV